MFKLNQVKIQYTAMVKETGHIFDSTVGKTALKFRLGTNVIPELKKSHFPFLIVCFCSWNKKLTFFVMLAYIIIVVFIQVIKNFLTNGMLE